MKNTVSQNIKIWNKTKQKKSIIQKCWPEEKYVNLLLTMVLLCMIGRPTCLTWTQSEEGDESHQTQQWWEPEDIYMPIIPYGHSAT